MTDPALDFASLLCSRLCHDLLSPVGAMANGLELLADENDPAMREQVVKLLNDSARASADRLKFFRLAFGAAGGFGNQVPTADLRNAAEGLVRGNARIQLGWMVEAASLEKHAAKILLNFAMVGFDALVRGGRLDIGAEGGEVVVRAEGARLVIDPEIRAVLAGEASDDAATARNSSAWLIVRLARSQGGTVRLVEDEPGVLLLAASLPQAAAQAA